MSKITLPFKKYKKSSIDLVEKTFDPDLRGEWTGNSLITNYYTTSYISKKYSSLLHTIPLVQFQILYDEELGKTVLVLGDGNTSKLNFLGKDSFGPYLKKYRNTDKRFTFYPISTAELNSTNDGLDYHAVSALYDRKTNKIEIFDSIGSDFTLYKETFKDLFVSIYGDQVKIVYIVDRCVAFGKLASEKCNKLSYNYKSQGFCAIWVLWFLEIRLANPSITKEKLIEKALKRLKTGNKVCELLRGYAQFVDNIFSKYSIIKTSSGLTIKPNNTKKIDLQLLYKLLMSIINIPVVVVRGGVKLLVFSNIILAGLLVAEQIYKNKGSIYKGGVKGIYTQLLNNLKKN